MNPPFHANFNKAINWPVSDARLIDKTGTGTISMSGASTFTGRVNVIKGILKAGVVSVAGVSGAFGNRPLVYLDPTNTCGLDITGFNTETGIIANGQAAGTIVLGASTLTIHQATALSSSCSAIISGTGGVTKSGHASSEQTLLGASTYTGPTTIKGGFLSTDYVANGGVASGIGAAAVAASNLVINGGTFKYTGPAASTNRQMTVGASGATFFITGSGTLTTSGNAWSSSGNIIVSGAGQWNAGHQFPAGSYTVTKQSTGYLNLQSTNMPTGAFNINGGQVQVTGSWAAGSTVTVNGGRLRGNGTVNGPLVLSNTAGTVVAGGAGPGSTGTLTLGGSLTFGGSTCAIELTTNGTGIVSQISKPALLTNVDLNNVTVGFAAGQNLDAGTYTVMTLGATSTFSGAATVGAFPANRSGMSVFTSANLLRVTVT